MTPWVTYLILGVTAVVTFIAFQRPDIKERLMFDPYAILRRKEFERMFTSGLIHADWMHFAMNAITLYLFGENIERVFGGKTLLLIYVSAILGGSLLSLIIHRHHEYRALGASGGACGVLFASIFLMPRGVMMFPVPFYMPAPIYAVVFLVASFVRHRSGKDNIGHDAHLGGAIIGLLVATALYPGLVLAEPWKFVVVMVMALVILLVLILDPLKLWEKVVTNHAEEDVAGERGQRYAHNRARNRKMADLDALLDKVSKEGINALSAKEREKLERLSKEIR